MLIAFEDGFKHWFYLGASVFPIIRLKIPSSPFRKLTLNKKTTVKSTVLEGDRFGLSVKDSLEFDLKFRFCQLKLFPGTISGLIMWRDSSIDY